ncbi:pfs domain-containing [Fusarium albosuccineum]|uniref:Pfs domain-containing n=1 Tax=Fusarium albosuccineum TaxID=1237068 RepID=A0A8H4KVM4_9HYPO|nr:pfs domain-containing [Fusarium albosuccineum]
MEVLGAVASSIAVVQALAAGKQIVSLVREIPEIQGDWDDMKKELDIVGSIVKVAEQQIRSSPSGPLERDLITQAASQLHLIVEELNDVLQSCVRETKEGDKKVWKAKRRKWLLEGSKIKKLEQKMQSAKGTLHFAVMSNGLSADVEFRAKAQMFMNFSIQLLTSQPPIEKGWTKELPDVAATPGSKGTSVRHGQELATCPVSQKSVDQLILATANADATSLRAATKIRGGYSPFWGPILSVAMTYLAVAETPVPAQTVHAYAISWGFYDGVEALLCRWESILPDVGLSRNALYWANHYLERRVLGDREKYLLEKVVGFVKDRPETTTTEVHVAIRRGEGLPEALRKEPWAVNMLDCTGLAPLHLAAKINRTEDVEALIDAHADVNQRNKDEMTPLMMAANSASVDSAKALLQAKCAVDRTSHSGATALHHAAYRNSPELVRLLLRAGASATTRSNMGRTPLHYSALGSTVRPGNLQSIMSMLIQAEADIDALDDVSSTPLLIALSKNNISAVRCLIDGGCSLSPVDFRSRSILHFAANNSRLETLQLLASPDLSGINPYLQDVFGNTPWDRFILAVYAPDWALGWVRRPNPAEMGAFIRLYQGARDRNLQQDIDCIEHVLGSLRDQDAAAAREHLAPLIDKEQEWERHDLVNWYRAVDKRIQHKEFSLAVCDVTQYLNDLKAELNTPVWEIESKHGFIRPPMYQDDDDDWVTEEEGSELELSDDDDLTETSKGQFS